MSYPLVKLDSVISFIRGVTFKPTDLVEPFSDGSVVVMRTKNIQVSGLSSNDLIAIPEKLIKRKEQYLQENDLLISSANSWELVGKTSYISSLGYKSTAGGFISIIRAQSEKIDARYLYYWIVSPTKQHEIRYCGRQTTNISNLDVGQFKELKIPLPPLDEQKRIAAILDKADSLRRKRQQAIQLADEFLRAVFLDLFGDPVTNPKGWKKEPLSNHFKIGTGGTPSRANPDNYGGDISWVKTTEVCGEVILKTSETISQKGLSDSNCKVYPKNSIIIAMYGQGKTRGQCGVLGIDAATNQACAILEPSETLEMNFVYQYIKYSYQQLRELSRGGNQQNLNLSLVKLFEIIIPDRKLQIYFSDIYLKVQKILKVSDDFKKDDLFNSLSQKAFSGEL